MKLFEKLAHRRGITNRPRAVYVVQHEFLSVAVAVFLLRAPSIISYNEILRALTFLYGVLKIYWCSDVFDTKSPANGGSKAHIYRTFALLPNTSITISAGPSHEGWTVPLSRGAPTRIDIVPLTKKRFNELLDDTYRPNLCLKFTHPCEVRHGVPQGSKPLLVRSRCTQSADNQTS